MDLVLIDMIHGSNTKYILNISRVAVWLQCEPILATVVLH